MLQNIIFLRLCPDSMCKKIFDLAALTSVALDHVHAKTVPWLPPILCRNLQPCLVDIILIATAAFCIFFLPGTINMTMPITWTLKQLGNRIIECKDLKSRCTHYTEMHLAFILNYLEIQFSTACFICICVFFLKMRQRIISPKATVDTAIQGNMLQNPKSN